MARGIAVVALLLCGVACKKKADDPVKESFSIEGTVQNEKTMAPVGGVQVKVAASDASGSPVSGSAGTAATDAAGHFSIAPYHYSNVASYELTFSKEGFYDARNSVPANYFSGPGHPTSYILLQTITAK